MQFSITVTLAIMSAGALALPTGTADGLMAAAQTIDTRNGLPYSNFDAYNHTLPSNANAPDNHTTNDFNHHHLNTSSNTTALSRRKFGSIGDIASYHDGFCTVNVTSKVDIMDSKWIKFSPLDGTNIGINWGSTLLRMQRLQTYTDDKCEKYGPKIKTPTSLGMDSKGAGSCKAYSEYLKTAGPWKSVWGLA